MKKALNTTLKIWLSICIAFSSAPFVKANAAGVTDDSKNKNLQNLIQKFPEALATDPQAKNDLLKLNLAMGALESGQALPNSPDKYDVFHLTPQRLEIANNGSVNIAEINTDAVAIPFSNLRIEYSVSKRELSFIATRGENDLGEHGTVVARHVISNLDIAGFIHDNEMLSLIDHRGNLSLIDMGYVATELGRNPIPIFKNVWISPTDLQLKNKQVTVKYINRGSPPPPTSIFSDPSIVIPRNGHGDPQFKAGDLLVTYNHDGQDKYVGIFSREISHAQIIRGSYLLEIQAALADPEYSKVEQLRKLFSEFDAYTELNEQALQSDRLNLEVRSALMSITPRQIKTLNQRRIDHEGYQQKPVDHFSLSEWTKSFSELRDRASAEISSADEQERLRLESQFSNQNLWKNWSQLVPSAERTNPIPIKKHKKMNLKYVSRLLQGVGLTYILYPLIHDAVAVQNQIQILNVFYESAYPAVLKDATYRIPLLLSMASLVGLWPLGVGISMAFEKALRTFDKALQNNKTKFAGYIRDLKKNWADLTVWQRINSFGMRVYAGFIYPAWVWIPKYILRQPSLISALQNELNPLTKISPGSEIGQLLDLKNSERLGINNPFVGQEKLKKKTEIKQKIQSIMLLQKKRTESLSWLLGSMIASEESGVDLATLLMTEHHDVTPEHLHKLLSDPQLQKNWYVAADLIYQQLWKLKTVGLNQDLTELDEKQIARAYEVSKQVAQKMNSSSSFAKSLRALNLKFKRAAASSTAFLLNLGVEDANFLRTIYTNKYVSSQVQKEFVPDHLMVVGIYGLVGERADLSHPEHLTASSHDFMWTTPPHLFDVAINTYAHFFVAGARMALVHQNYKANEAHEYQPIENFKYSSDDRQEGLASGLKNWFWDTLRPWKSDVGGIMIRRLYKSFTTIQANILQNLLFRMALGGQSFDHASKGWGMWFAQGQWRYGWPWDFIQAGNKLEEERIDQGIETDKALRLELSLALREADPSLSEQKLRIAYEKIFDAYQKNYPQALTKLEKLLSTKNQSLIIQRHQELMALKKQANEIHAKSQNYYGLLSKLAIAMTKNNPEELQRIESLLTHVLSTDLSTNTEEQEELRREILKLNAEGLLEFSLTNPPHYTKAHPWVSWLAAWTGAISTTVMAISLSVDSFTPELLNWSYIGKWFLISAGLYTSAYLLLGKKPWEFYFKKIEQLKSRWGRTQNPAFSTEKKTNICKQIFKNKS